MKRILLLDDARSAVIDSESIKCISVETLDGEETDTE